MRIKEIWVLSERTVFNRGGKWDYQNYRADSQAFDSFENAKTAMMERIVQLAHQKGW